MPGIDQEFHDVLSRILRDYPKLWRPRGGPQFGQYQELAEKVSQELQRKVSAKKVKGNLKDIRRRLERLDQGSSTCMKTSAYLWYAEELKYMRAAEMLTTATSVESIPSTSTAAASAEKKHQLLRASESSARQLSYAEEPKYVPAAEVLTTTTSVESIPSTSMVAASAEKKHQLFRASKSSARQLLRASKSSARQLLRASESSARQLLCTSESSARQLLYSEELKYVRAAEMLTTATSVESIPSTSAAAASAQNAHYLLRASEYAARQLLRASESAARQLLRASESSARQLLRASETSARQLLRASESSALQLLRASESSALQSPPHSPQTAELPLPRNICCIPMIKTQDESPPNHSSE
uniref:MADF domain-containing protein n=1 Tax=Glossina palpalis gambiensis TaxID=67801 RepID=A0A1B0BE74_9MUSC